MIPGDTDDWVMVTNVTQNRVWLPLGAVIGQVDDDFHLPEDVDAGIENLPVDQEMDHSYEGISREDMGKRLGSNLSLEEREKALEVLMKHLDCFARNDLELGHCPFVQHSIETGDALPISQPPYKSAWKERELIQAQVDRMLQQGIIEESQSPWSSPVVLVKKPDGSWRFCVDYRRLNSVTVNDVYPIPVIENALHRLEGSILFSILDLQAGYHQLSVAPQDRPKTAFVTADGLYQYKVVPFGLKCAPSRFQRTMDLVLAGLRWTSCLVYIDDIIIYGRTLEEHLERLSQVLTSIKGAGLKLKLKKCRFLEAQLKALGHVVSQWGVSPDPEKVKAVAEFPAPDLAKSRAQNVKLIQSFVGLCSYYRRHVPAFSKVAKPLTNLMKQNTVFIWEKEQRESFEKLKQALADAATLNYPRRELPMEIYPDACGYGLGATLSQKLDGIEKPLCFASRLLSKTEANYSITELECLALV